MTQYRPGVSDEKTNQFYNGHESDSSSPIGSSEGKTTLLDDTSNEMSDGEVASEVKTVSKPAVNASFSSESAKIPYIRRFVKKNDIKADQVGDPDRIRGRNIRLYEHD